MYRITNGGRWPMAELDYVFAIEIPNTRENKSKVSTPLYQINKAQNIAKEELKNLHNYRNH